MKTLNVVIVKPSKYTPDGYVERFRWGLMPNMTVPYLRSMTPREINGCSLNVHTIDEYVHRDTNCLQLLRRQYPDQTLVALVGVQSHQLQRALDLAAYAREHGSLAVIGGPHPMTCDTSMLQGRGISFALAEAETIWPAILNDAIIGELQPVYGRNQRWAEVLDAPVLIPPSSDECRRYLRPMLGVYPARGCPFICNFCSVIKIAGRKVRSQSIETTIASLKAAASASIRLIIFCSDNLNKYSEVRELLQRMIDERINIRFFCQCDVQIARDPELVELLARAGCFQIFVGVESFNRETLLAARKNQNHPEQYRTIIRLCREHNIRAHFSNIIGFPTDTEETILDHLRQLRELKPAVASFYLLTPIPGTEQYAEFKGAGLITEHNLDRYDAIHPTWEHPHLSAADLRRLLWDCYRKFYSLSHLLNTLLQIDYRRISDIVAIVANSAFVRFCAQRKTHPMAGGVGRILRDHVRDYAHLRRKYFALDLVPLPDNLRLTTADEVLNRTVTLRA